MSTKLNSKSLFDVKVLQDLSSIHKPDPLKHHYVVATETISKQDDKSITFS